MKEKGYNAIMDEEDIRNRTAYAPMIIFDGGSSLAVTGKQEITKELHDQSRVQYEDAKKEMIRSRGWKKNWG